MDSALFDYPLDPARIAQAPAAPRDAARLLVVGRAARRVSHHVFRELPDLLPPGARLFRNDAAVFKARLRLRRATGGALECLLLHPDLRADAAGSVWRCLLRPGKKLPAGAPFGADGVFTATVLEKFPDGQCLARFDVPGGRSVPEVAEQIGETPLPPYIARGGAGAAPAAGDLASYQTVYADPAKKIAAAAPTAGLHFTPEVLAALAARGVPMHDLALRVGLGTFRPIAAERIEEHVIHREWYEIPAATRAALHAPGGPRLAVGTTTLRAIEDYFAKNRPDAGGVPAARPAGETPTARAVPQEGTASLRPHIASSGPGTRRGADLPRSSFQPAAPSAGPWLAEADIFIHPPRTFAGAEMLLTNFHLPRSTLLCLVSAFLAPGSADGIAWLKEIYADAAARGYRFYSYGDAMLIV